jgi:hypothetical protein
MKVLITNKFINAYNISADDADIVAMFSTYRVICESCRHMNTAGEVIYVIPAQDDLTLCESCATDNNLTADFDLRQTALIKQMKQSMADNPTNASTPEPPV